MYNEQIDNLCTPCLNNGKSVFFFFIIFDHYHVKKYYSPLLERTPVYQVTLQNDRKHLDGSLFVANQMRLCQTMIDTFNVHTKNNESTFFILHVIIDGFLCEIGYCCTVCGPWSRGKNLNEYFLSQKRSSELKFVLLVAVTFYYM